MPLPEVSTIGCSAGGIIGRRRTITPKQRCSTDAVSSPAACNVKYLTCTPLGHVGAYERFAPFEAEGINVRVQGTFIIPVKRSGRVCVSLPLLGTVLRSDSIQHALLSVIRSLYSITRQLPRTGRDCLLPGLA